MKRFFMVLCVLAGLGCIITASGAVAASQNPPANLALGAGAAPSAVPAKTAHVVVALCDTIFQRIAPVKPELGDGNTPASNLYWGAMYGVKTFLPKQSGWKLLHVQTNPAPLVLERLVLFNETLNLTVVADAWQGMAIREATSAFLEYAAGRTVVDVFYGGKTLKAGAGAGLVVYMGHNGLMDFSLPFYPMKSDAKPRDAVIFACQSKNYFADAIKAGGAYPLLRTTGNMAPEAYILHALLNSWGREDEENTIREEVAKAYNQYQKCGMKAARSLFAAGW